MKQFRLMKRYGFAALFGALLPLVGVLKGRGFSEALPSDSLKTRTGESGGERVVESGGEDSGVVKAASSLPAGKYARDQRIAEDPDGYFDPDRTDLEYQRKVRRHNQIGQFLTSSRKDDPVYQKVMLTLLENGYGIEEWGEAVSILGFYHLPVVAERQALMNAGFSPQQIEGELEDAKRQQHRHLRMVEDNLLRRCGISDPDLVKELLAIELEFLPNEDVIGLGPLRTIRGDRLLGDEDWLDEDFLAARARYQGEPRIRPDPFELAPPLPSDDPSTPDSG